MNNPTMQKNQKQANYSNKVAKASAPSPMDMKGMTNSKMTPKANTAKPMKMSNVNKAVNARMMAKMPVKGMKKTK